MIELIAEDIKQALSFVMKAHKRTKVSAYQDFVLVTPSEGKAMFTFFDGSRELSTLCDAEWKEEKPFAIDMLKLNQRVALSNDGDKVRITEKDGRATLKIGRSSTKLNVFDPVYYPVFELKEAGTLIKVDASELRKSINLVKGCVPSNDVRKFLNGICFDVRGGSLTLVASDGRRLNKDDIESEIDSNSDFTAVLPQPSIAPLLHILESGECQLYITNSKIIVHTDKGTLKEARIDGKFPDWRRLVSMSPDIIAKFNVIELRNAIKVAMITASEANNFAVQVKAMANSAVISSSLMDGSSTVEQIECSSNGEIDIAISGRYLDQVLPFIEDGNVEIQYDSNISNRIAIHNGGFMAMIMLVVI